MIVRRGRKSPMYDGGEKRGVCDILSFRGPPVDLSDRTHTHVCRVVYSFRNVPI